jgi:outer membrane murein-binding lipoprotein Lpp
VVRNKQRNNAAVAASIRAMFVSALCLALAATAVSHGANVRGAGEEGATTDENRVSEGATTHSGASDGEDATQISSENSDLFEQSQPTTELVKDFKEWFGSLVDRWIAAMSSSEADEELRSTINTLNARLDQLNAEMEQLLGLEAVKIIILGVLLATIILGIIISLFVYFRSGANYRELIRTRKELVNVKEALGGLKQSQADTGDKAVLTTVLNTEVVDQLVKSLEQAMKPQFDQVTQSIDDQSKTVVDDRQQTRRILNDLARLLGEPIDDFKAEAALDDGMLQRVQRLEARLDEMTAAFDQLAGVIQTIDNSNKDIRALVTSLGTKVSRNSSDGSGSSGAGPFESSIRETRLPDALQRPSPKTQPESRTDDQNRAVRIFEQKWEELKSAGYSSQGSQTADLLRKAVSQSCPNAELIIPEALERYDADFHEVDTGRQTKQGIFDGPSNSIKELIRPGLRDGQIVLLKARVRR